MKINELIERLKRKGLRVTPQRIVVLEALVNNDSHPNADTIIRIIKKKNPNISFGTIYNILDTFVENGIITKVQTADNVMRYDPLVFEHHHIYLKDSDKVLDYFDENLTKLVKDYLKDKKELSGIDIESININITGQN